VDFNYVFAGYIAVFNLALHLHRQGYRTRLVIVDPCAYEPAAWARRIRAYPGLETLFDCLETAYVGDRRRPLEVSPKDRFVSTSWWTAHIAHRAAAELGNPRFVLLTQDYEPLFYPAGSMYALAQEAYAFPHDAVFSTEMLRSYFRRERLGVYRHGEAAGDEASVAIENAVGLFPLDAGEMARRRPRRLLFYARPEPHAARNMFELGVLALRAAVSEAAPLLRGVELHGMGAGERYRSVPLGGGLELELIERVSLLEYQERLTGYDVGLSLMLSPHPSMVPLDMAAAGLVTVTNTFATKTRDRLAAISPNLVAVEPTVGAVKDGLLEAVGRTEKIDERIAGTRLEWPRTWQASFGDAEAERLARFLSRD
jgi:hypothetical protein